MEALIFFCFVSPLLVFSAYGVNTLPLGLEKPYFEAIYQFGDSIADTGNSVYEDALAKCGRPPYGQTFFHHPTGRCSDGRLIIDFFAQALNLPFLEPYLDKDGNFSHGVNFAVAGATALNASTLAAKEIPLIITNNSLWVQLNWFKSHLNALHSPPSECKKKLGKSLFIVGEIGGNDYNYGAYSGKTMEELQALVPEVIETIMNVVKELIDLGAKQIIVPGNFPVGCMTIYLALFQTDDSTMYDELNCLRSWNEFAMFHNDQLQNAIKDLPKEHPAVAIVYWDYYTALTSIIKHASSLGFEKDGWQKACCGRGNELYNFGGFGEMCGFDGVPVCLDPSKRVSWDGVHLTEHAYQLMASWLVKDIVSTKVQVA